MALVLRFITICSLFFSTVNCSSQDERISILSKYDKDLDKRLVVLILKDNFCFSCIRIINNFVREKENDNRILSIFYYNHGGLNDIRWLIDSKSGNQIVIRPFKETNFLFDSSKVIFIKNSEIQSIKPLSLNTYQSLIQEIELKLLD